MKVVQITLANQERIIKRGLSTFVEVGEALARIRDHKLYREQGHRTFADYCQERWGWQRAHAYRLIAGLKRGKHGQTTGTRMQSWAAMWRNTA